MNYDWDFSAISGYLPMLWHGFINTVLLSLLVISVGTPIGIVWACLLEFTPRPIRFVLLAFVDAIRGLPILPFTLAAYYALPILLPSVRLSVFLIAAIALSTYLAAFTADLVRGSLRSVPEGRTDAAFALGFSGRQVFWRFRLPWVCRTSFPAFTLLAIGMLKHTSVASVIGVYELTHSANTIIANTFRSLETYSLVAAGYLILVLPAAALARRIEKRLVPDASEKTAMA
jgi:polar amino acid transport system permease protein